jgi:hypothetical protein
MARAQSTSSIGAVHHLLHYSLLASSPRVAQGGPHVGTIKSKLQSGALHIMLNALAVLAFVALLLSPWPAIGYVLAAATLIGVGVRTRAEVSPSITALALVTAGLLVDYDRHLDGPRLPLGIAALILAVLVVNMPVIESILNRPAIQVANLPGYRDDDGLLVAPSLLYTANPILVGLLGVFAAARLTAWPLVAVFALDALLVGVVGLQGLRIRLHGTDREKKVRAALEKHNPAFALYFSAPDHTEYHVEMWRPYLERVGQPWMLILREPQPFRNLAKAAARAGVPVLYCPLIEHVDEVVTPGLKAVFYVNNGMKNMHLVRFNHLTHIQLLHGDSDKASSFNPVTAMYDRVFVAGQAGIDRYAANGVLIPAEKFDIVGRPQVETIKVTRDQIRDVTDKVVLYATTWVSHYDDANYSSLRIGEKIISKLLARGATIILRPHPYTERDAASARSLTRLHQLLAEDRERTGRAHLYGPAATTELSVFDCANQADAMISDVSGVASDFLYSGKPFAMTNMLGETREQFETSFPLARAAYVIEKDGSSIDDVLDNLLEEDPFEKVRHEVKTYYLGDFPEEAYAYGFVDAVRKYS